MNAREVRGDRPPGKRFLDANEFRSHARTHPLIVPFALMLAASAALAGPNAGGVLVIHAPGITYVGGNVCSQGTAPDSCGDVRAEIDDAGPDTLRVWKVYAAFPPGSSPRLKGLTFGVSYDGDYSDGTGTVVRAYGTCTDFELAMTGWPGSNKGTSLLWDGRDSRGNRVASGRYFLLVTDETGKTKSNSVTIIR